MPCGIQLRKGGFLCLETPPKWGGPEDQQCRCNSPVAVEKQRLEYSSEMGYFFNRLLTTCIVHVQNWLAFILTHFVLELVLALIIILCYFILICYFN